MADHDQRMLDPIQALTRRRSCSPGLPLCLWCILMAGCKDHVPRVLPRSAESDATGSHGRRSRQSSPATELNDSTFMLTRIPGSLAALTTADLPQWKEDDFIRHQDIYVINGGAGIIIYDSRAQKILRMSDSMRAVCSAMAVILQGSLFVVCRAAGKAPEILEIELSHFALQRSYGPAQGLKLDSSSILVPVGADLWVETGSAHARIDTQSHRIIFASPGEAQRAYAQGPADPAILESAAGGTLPPRDTVMLSPVFNGKRYVLTDQSIELVDQRLAFPTKLIEFRKTVDPAAGLAWLIDRSGQFALVISSACSCHGGGADLFLISLSIPRVIVEQSWDEEHVTLDRLTSGTNRLEYQNNQFQVWAAEGVNLLTCDERGGCTLFDAIAAEQKTAPLVQMILDEDRAPRSLLEQVSKARLAPGAQIHQRDLARALNTRGYRLFNKVQLDDALAFFQAAAAIDAHYGMPRYNAARVQAIKGDVEGCLASLRELKQLGRGQRARLQQALKDKAFTGLLSNPKVQEFFSTLKR